MITNPTYFLRIALGVLLAAGSLLGFSSCSADDTAHRQQGITDTHQDMVDRREARQQARDQRFQSSRDSWMN
ncbi:MAG TPA: hypothetical protein VGJ26_15780 [Pirellulales bacterium]|jgi:hypothetical protein